ncbi:peptide deformylase [Clostridium botulinum]|uniref:Peptide deformylase n=1 Tax=Clostridium botulinum C/D str. DC5 TaxID=1443128 RepID=A0A0A0ILJ6_CLOBO|nr:peptide deformylase [Clostridium botulinum]KEI04646.1 peptide deformylase [Clostridium botulinum C/D str. BKT75002]KEI06099.1 peptide deformylase [Clostridium botulinum C/D str. BKT2873]KGM93696.1 peptide deformylase [Clostridium botulinum D str. CCUG 7971]KGN01499.1 peptide deformylase [Clostridium botulinum C/D str. DC5]KOC49818.1 peptide deformylase [Clostridium botulinum]
MAIKEIVTTENKLLRRKSKRIESIDDEVLELIQDLKDTLYSADGVGLAAPQIGVLKRAFIIDLRDGNGPLILLNPKILKKIGKYEDGEGCLSYPGYEGIVVRPRKVIVSGMNEKGESVQYEATGLMSRAICHETDHLDGILYMDLAKKMYKIPTQKEKN